MNLQYYKLFESETSQGVVGLLRPSNTGLRTQSGAGNTGVLSHSGGGHKAGKAGTKKHFHKRGSSGDCLNVDITCNVSQGEVCTDYFYVTDTPSHPIYIFKISNNVDNVLEHELKVARDIEDLSAYLPHFNRLFGIQRNVRCGLPNKRKRLPQKDEVDLLAKPCLSPSASRSGTGPKAATLNPRRGSEAKSPGGRCTGSSIRRRSVTLRPPPGVEAKPAEGRRINLFKCDPTERCSVRDVLIGEYIPSRLTFRKYILQSHFGAATDAILHQLILALFVAQQEKRFTHYDLHLENILIRKCMKRTFFWYKFSYQGVILNRLVETKGYFPVIFDYGFAYSKGLDHTSYMNSLFFTNKGYTPFKFDETTDFRMLIVRMAYYTKCPAKFKGLAKKLFPNVDVGTGWLQSSKPSIGKIMCNKLDKILLKHGLHKSFLYKQLDYIVDLFGTLITIPFSGLRPDNDWRPTVEDKPEMKSSIESAICDFVSEWQKIEAWFPEHANDDKLNILKQVLINIDKLIVSTKQSEELEHQFRLAFFQTLDMFGDYIILEDLKYHTFISSILQIAEFIELTYHKETLRTPPQVQSNPQLDAWAILKEMEDLVMVQEPYDFKEADSVVLFDCIAKTTSSFELEDADTIELLNKAADVATQIAVLNNIPTLAFDEIS
jgi:hypothetical protein